MVRIVLSFGGASISYLLSILPSPNENFFQDKKVYEYEYFQEKIALMKDELELHHNK